MTTCQSGQAKIGYACIYHVSIFCSNWGWTSLPNKYLENEYLPADLAILTNPSDGGSNPPTCTVSNSPAQGDLDGEETMSYTVELPQHQVSITGNI